MIAYLTIFTALGINTCTRRARRGLVASHSIATKVVMEIEKYKVESIIHSAPDYA